MGKRGKGTRNGFFFFMSEMRTNLRLATMQEASIIADPIWKTMPMDARQVYDDKAAKSNRANRAKMTAAHENLEHLMRAEESKARREKEMKEEIETMINSLADMKHLEHEQFIVMHWNSFGYIQAHNRHYPAEVAIAQFSLREGVDMEDVFHMIVNPGKMPLGYAYTAKAISNSSHQLPPPIDDSEINLEEVMVSIYSYIESHNIGSKKFPPIFVKDNDMAQVQGIMNQLCFDFDFDSEKFKIYSLQHLLFCLVNSMDRGGVPVWPTINQSVGELEQDAYDYTTGISCTYHDECDVTVYCSKSIVIRSVYIICGNCCRFYDIPMVYGKHIPLKSDDSTSSYLSEDLESSSEYRPTSDESSVSYTSAATPNRVQKQQNEQVVSNENGSSVVSNVSYASATSSNPKPSGQLDRDKEWKIVSKKKSVKNGPSSSSSSSPEACRVSNDTTREPSTSAAAAQFIQRPPNMSEASTSTRAYGAVPKIGRGRGRNVRH